jgi:hypothetical protein
MTICTAATPQLGCESPIHERLNREHADPDRALHEAVMSMLKASGYSSVAKLACRVHRGVVELDGVVPTFHLKQVAQTAVQRVGAVRGIRNRVVVGY